MGKKKNDPGAQTKSSVGTKEKKQSAPQTKKNHSPGQQAWERGESVKLAKDESK